MNVFDSLVTYYAELKAQEKEITPKIKKVNNEIKERILNGEEVSEDCEYKATVSIIDKSYFDESKLLSTLKELGFTNCIKTKEYVDMNILENEMYQGTITADQIKDCKVKKEEQRLNVNKKKKGE